MQNWQMVVIGRLARKVKFLAPLLNLAPVSRVLMVPWLLRVVEVVAQVAMGLFVLLALLAAVNNWTGAAIFVGLLALLAFGIFRAARWTRQFVQVQKERVLSRANGYFEKRGVVPQHWQGVAKRGADLVRSVDTKR